MKSKDLIAKLLKDDPTGEAEVVIGGQDIWFIQAMEMYYDGTPILLKRDCVNKEEIIGYRVSRNDNCGKIQLMTLDMDDFIESYAEEFDETKDWDNPEHLNEFRKEILSKMDWDCDRGKEMIENAVDRSIAFQKQFYNGEWYKEYKAKMRTGNDFP